MADFTIYLGISSQKRREEVLDVFADLSSHLMILSHRDTVMSILCDSGDYVILADIDFLGLHELEIYANMSSENEILPLVVFHEQDQKSLVQSCSCHNFLSCRSYSSMSETDWYQIIEWSVDGPPLEIKKTAEGCSDCSLETNHPVTESAGVDDSHRLKPYLSEPLFIDAAGVLAEASLMTGHSQEQLEKLFRVVNGSLVEGAFAHFIPINSQGDKIRPHFAFEAGDHKLELVACLAESFKSGSWKGAVAQDLVYFINVPSHLNNNCLIVTVAGSKTPEGFLLLISNTSLPISNEDEQVVRAIANLLTMHSERQATTAGHREIRATLEQTVAQRVRALKEVNEKLVAEVEEREKYESMLIESEAYYRSLIEYASDLITIIDKDGLLLYQSPGVKRNLGYSLSEVKGSSSFDIVHPDDQDKVRFEVQKVLNNPGYLAEVSYRVKAHDGKWRRHEGIARNLLEDDVVKGIIINSRDVTEEQRLIRALQNILEGTSAVTGSQFFQLLVKHIAESLGVKGAILLDKSELDMDHLNIRSMWWNGQYYNKWQNKDGRDFIPIDSYQDVISINNLSIRLGKNHKIIKEGIEALLGLSVRLSNGDLVGYVAVINDKNITIDSRNVSTLKTFASRVGAELARDRAEKDLHQQAYFDMLTGLPNRRYFTDVLNQAFSLLQSEETHQISLLFLDMDRFKVINDSLGHLLGDKLLVSVADRLKKQLPDASVFARLSGDEFAILIQGDGAYDLSETYAERICQEFSDAFKVDGYDVYTSVSIGIAHADKSGMNGSDLLRNSDNAMYAAKAHGRNQWKLYDDLMHEAAMKTFHLENELKGAVERSEFVMHYQPIVRLSDHVIVGLEALVRWNHPQRGLLSPSEFLDICEETGHIIAIDRWVLEQVIKDMRSLDHIPEHFRVNVNVSGVHIIKQDMAEYYTRQIQQSGLSAKHIGIEITEGALMSHDDSVIETLNQIKELGSSIIIDDFGIGYSSLARLHLLPINDIKIDKSFVDMMSDKGNETEIIWAILTLANNLGLGVVAEGIEHYAQAKTLDVMRCQKGQGYYFSEPKEFNEVRALIENPIALGEGR